MERQFARLLVVATIICVITGGLMAVFGFRNHDYLQSRFVQLSEENQKDLATCIIGGKEEHGCYAEWSAEEAVIGHYLLTSYTRLDGAIKGLVIAIGVPIVIWFAFFCARWIRTGRWQKQPDPSVKQ